MTTEVQVKDVAGVRSRVSWGAILSGAMTAIAIFVLLSVLGTAIGATILYRQGDADLNTGAAIWAVMTLILALFCGGCVASQCTAGETKEESVIYGVILWGTIFTLLLALTTAGASMGFGSLMGATLNNNQATTGNTAFTAEDYRKGLSDEQINRMRQTSPAQLRGDELSQKAHDLARDQRTVTAAWWTFGGILLSMLAAVSGALTGAGPNFRLVSLGFRRLHTTHTTATRTAV